MEKYGRGFKELNFKEKLHYIKEYYLWYIIACLIGGSIMISILISVFSPPQVYSVDVLVAGALECDETEPVVDNAYKDKMDTDINFLMANWESLGEMEVAVMQKIPVLVHTESLDILAVEPDMFKSYASQEGMLVPLEEIPEMAELLEKYEDRLVTWDKMTTDTGEIVDGEEHIYGIRVAKSSKMPNIPCLTMYGDYVFGLTSTVKDIDKTVDVLEYMLEGSK